MPPAVTEGAVIVPEPPRVPVPRSRALAKVTLPPAALIEPPELVKELLKARVPACTTMLPALTNGTWKVVVPGGGLGVGAGGGVGEDKGGAAERVVILIAGGGVVPRGVVQ